MKTEAILRRKTALPVYDCGEEARMQERRGKEKEKTETAP